MATEATIDFETALAPLGGDRPAGESLRYAGTYDAIREARKADDPSLAQGDWKRELKVANWREVIRLAIDALSTKSKDLQIAGWLTEALVKQHGFAGARDGFRIIRELHERFWEGLFPEIEDGDLEFRAGAIQWLDDKLPASIFDIALTPLTSTGEAYSFVKWLESRKVEELALKNPEARQAAIAENKVTGEQWDKAVALGDRAFYETLFADISESFSEFNKLMTVVDEKFGREAPSFMLLKKALQDCADLVRGIVEKKRQLEPDPQRTNQPAGVADTPATTSEDTAVVVTGARVAPARVLNNGSISLDPVDRADALRRLESIADYFHRTEPHSPVSYLVQRAVRWGQMPLEQWLTDVITDEAVLAHIRETLGIRGSGENSGA